MTSAPSDEALYPIREVSRRTGVNAVTLRAWERRYGLLKPQRTPKGHRLYTAADIALIERILQWLNRGVAIGQVRELLAREQPPHSTTEEPVSDTWQAYRQQLQHAIHALQVPRVDELLNEALALYPADTFNEQLMQPLLRQLEETWQGQFGAALEARLLESCLHSKTLIRLHQGNRVNRGAHLLLLPLPDEPRRCPLLLSALLASAQDCRVQLLEDAVPLAELPLAIDKLAIDLLLLYGSRAQSSEQLQRLAKLARTVSVPVGVIGPSAAIHRQPLAAAAVHPIPQLSAAELTRLLKRPPRQPTPVS